MHIVQCQRRSDVRARITTTSSVHWFGRYHMTPNDINALNL